MAGFVYAVYENEESLHQILHTCSTKTDRTLDDGRCEYYLEVFSQRTTSRRKSVGKIIVKILNKNFVFFRFKLFLGLWLVFAIRMMIARHLLHLLGRFSMVIGR
jgi:hypothetical protein